MCIRDSLHNHALRQTRVQLLRMSDWQLADVGISRRLLNQGIASWPWREATSSDSELTAQPSKMKAKEINDAIADLSRMSDAQLKDIGITRGTIRHSVQRGVDSRDPGPKHAA